MLRDKSPEQADLRLSPNLLRRFSGPKATEIFLRCRPEAGEIESLAQQTESVYRQLKEALGFQGGSLEHVVRETVFFRNISLDMEDFQKARARVLQDMGHPNSYTPATICIEQPPLDGLRSPDWALSDDGLGADALLNGDCVDLEILVQAVIPHSNVSSVTWGIEGEPRCRCGTCADLGARALLIGGQKHMFAGNIFGAPGGTFDEALSMFEVAGRLLQKEGMDFRCVARTWIYLRDMERDYGEFNRARRVFFEKTGVTLHPASTGINGTPFPPEHNFVLGFYAIQGPHAIPMEAMTTPTLNEAPEYGSDFSRGLRVIDSNKISLFISGTASVDEKGATVHEEDFEAQVDRMMLNISVLLERQNATFRDMVYAISYIKRGADAPAFRRILRDRGIVGFPNVIVEAGVCRPDLLCEVEGVAILPRGQAGLRS